MVPACSLGDVLSGGCFCVRFTHLHKFWSTRGAVDTDIQRYYPGRIVTNDTYQVRLGIVRLTILAAIVIVRLIVNRAIADIKNEHVSIQRME